MRRMSSGFGRVVVNGIILDDPYGTKLDDLAWFEVISDAGPRYRVERFHRHRWRVTRVDPEPVISLGTVVGSGSVLNQRYSFTREGQMFSSGQQNMFINTVFGLL